MLRIPNSPPVSCVAAIAVLGVAAVAHGQPGRGPAPVVVAPVTEDAVLSTQTFVGTVLPSQRAEIGSAVDGRVEVCDIEEGDRVEANQPLAMLLTDTIELEVKSAQAQLDYLEAQLLELRNGTRKEQLAQARARVASAEARREYQIGLRERLRELAGQSNALTEDEWREAVTLALEADANYEQAKAVYDEAEAGPRAEAIAQAEAQVAMQQAVVERLHDQLGKHTIRSRFAGYVVRKSTEVGQWVNRGDLVAEVVGADVVEVVVQVAERSIPFVQPNQEVTIEIPALPDSLFTGNVLAAVPQGDERARTFPVRVRLENQSTESGPKIKPGMYARVELPVGEEKQATLVPKDALVLSENAPSVFVVEQASEVGQKGSAAPVPVEVIQSYGDRVEVKGKLRSGQWVVVEGNERLRPGAPIVISKRVEDSALVHSAAP